MLPRLSSGLCPYCPFQLGADVPRARDGCMHRSAEMPPWPWLYLPLQDSSSGDVSPNASPGFLDLVLGKHGQGTALRSPRAPWTPRSQLLWPPMLDLYTCVMRINTNFDLGDFMGPSAEGSLQKLVSFCHRPLFEPRPAWFQARGRQAEKSQPTLGKPSGKVSSTEVQASPPRPMPFFFSLRVFRPRFKL